MSKGLEALERIEVDMEYVTRLDFVEPIVRGEVQQELYKIYHREEKDLDIIKKELKALEIIRNKPWLVGEIVESKGDYKAYKSWCSVFRADMKYRATEEEFNLLKEVLLWAKA